MGEVVVFVGGFDLDDVDDDDDDDDDDDGVISGLFISLYSIAAPTPLPPITAVPS